MEWQQRADRGTGDRLIEMTISMTYKQVMNMPLLAPQGVSISDLKKNPSAVIAAAEGGPVAILNHNRPTAYLIPAEAWENIMERLDDIELAEIVRQREGQPTVRVRLDDL